MSEVKETKVLDVMRRLLYPNNIMISVLRKTNICLLLI